MSWPSRINRVRDHVREHLAEPLGLEELARVAHSSRFHFARLFKAHTGETLTHFVQRARLERAATLMRSSPEQSLLQIALEVGLGSASDFSRIFKRHHGIAPSQWDRRSRLHDVLPGYTDHLAQARESCPPLRPRVVRHAACRFAYVRVATPFLDAGLLQQGYERVCRWFEAHGVDWRDRPMLGMSWDNPETTPLHQVRFDLGFTLPEGLRASGEVGERALPAMRSVDVRVQGSLGHIALAWEHLYDEWLPAHSPEPVDLPGIKRFHRRPDELGWQRFDLDCCIALHRDSQ
ncbi:MAG: AraC family transcriptional regulator [Myxococcota bacterium]